MQGSDVFATLASYSTCMPRPPPWKRKRPSVPKKKLTPGEIALARARAKKAGRRYPNLVDNMWVLSKRR
jgi:hypothetical protein